MKRILHLTLAALLLLSLPPASADGGDTPIYARLVVPIFFEAEIPEDIGLINEAVNRITQAQIGATIELVPLLFHYFETDPRRIAELDMLEKQGTVLDVFPDVLPDIRPIALDGWLALYGQDLLALIGEMRLSHARAGDGQLYYLPVISDYVASIGITMRKDILERHRIDISRIHSFDDLDSLFQNLSQLEPGMKMVSPYLTRNTLISRLKMLGAVPGSVCDQSAEDPRKIVNYYATDTYRRLVELFRSWHERGYLPDHMALQSIRASQLVGAGELFSYICAHKPGIDYEESSSCGTEMVTIPLAAPQVTLRSINLTQWCVSADCANPGKAVQFLNLLYSNSDLVNLLAYGIEGIHYERQADGTIGYPQGVDGENAGYQNTLQWLLPNQMISHVWQGNDPQLWEKLQAYNESAEVAAVIDFQFDSSQVQLENSRLSEIASRYAYGLETGQLDPAVYLPQMLDEMEAAGAALVLEEAQRQFDLYWMEKEADG